MVRENIYTPLAANIHLHMIALANTLAVYTSMRWWWAIRDRNISRLAMTVGYLLHATIAIYPHDLETALDWICQACMLAALGYSIAYAVERLGVSFLVWFLFLCVQTYNTHRWYYAAFHLCQHIPNLEEKGQGS